AQGRGGCRHRKEAGTVPTDGATSAEENANYPAPKNRGRASRRGWRNSFPGTVGRHCSARENPNRPGDALARLFRIQIQVIAKRAHTGIRTQYEHDIRQPLLLFTTEVFG